MKNIIVNQHLIAIISSFKRLKHRLISSFFIVLMLAIALALPLSLYLTVQSFDLFFKNLTINPTITIFMDTNSSQIQIEDMAQSLQNNPNIVKVKFVDKQQALKETATQLGQQELTNFFETNPLPDAFIVTPRNYDPDELAGLTTSLENMPQVNQVLLDSQWVQTLYLIKKFLVNVLLFISVTLGFAFILVSNNTIRLQILSFKDEIEVSHLLGAPSSFIRRPFLYQALWQGILTTILGILIASAVSVIAYNKSKFIFSPYGVELQKRLFNMPEMLIITLIVVVLALLGAAWGTWQFLREFKQQVG